MRGSRSQIVEYICAQIATLYPQRECRQIAHMVAAQWSGDKEIRFLTEPNEEIEIDGLEQLVVPLTKGCPVQYVTGKAEFCGEVFSVRQGVLIPRPETEELVLWAEERVKGFAGPRILDICTGSGCIAIALKRRIPQATLTAIDFSEEALAVARENATTLNAEVEILRDDVLQGLPSVANRTFDVVVSNPPYIPLSERSAMHTNVTDHEPHMALFVPDNDPLIFYRHIARVSRNMLSPEGWLLFEIHSPLADLTAEMLSEEGYTNIEIRKDLFEKPRMICCQPKRA